MKLKEWAEKEGISYITAYRWFKAGTMPVSAYQTDSGTIIVEEKYSNSYSQPEKSGEKLSDSPVSQLIKKAFEMSKNGDPIEDFATFVISNFKLEKHEVVPDINVRKSRVKPSKEMTENHLKNFLKKDKIKSEPQMSLVNKESMTSVVAASENVSAIENDLGFEFSGNQQLNTVVPSSNSYVSDSSFQSFISEINTNISQNKAYTPLSYTSGASITPSALSFSHLPYFTGDMTDALSYLNTSNLEDINHENNYNPVTYDEARSLVELIMDPIQKENMLAVDKKAKEICKLDRETFELMLSATKK